MIFIYYSNYLPHQLRFSNIQGYLTLGTVHTRVTPYNHCNYFWPKIWQRGKLIIYVWKHKACACKFCRQKCVCVCVCVCVYVRTGVHLHFTPHHQGVSNLFCDVRRAAVHVRTWVDGDDVRFLPDFRQPQGLLWRFFRVCTSSLCCSVFRVHSVCQ